MVQIFNKKFSIYLFALLTVFAACKKEDETAFDQSPDERINATLTKYQTILTSSQYGWKGVVQPTGGGAYSFYFKFNNENRVVMYSDFDSSTATTPKESSYRLKALQQPSLLFDTYSYLHLLSDPNENTITIQSDVNGLKGGALGLGLQSDFEFAIDSATDNTVYLTGRQHGSKAFLTKATQEEATAFENRQLAAPLLQLQNLNKLLYYFKRLTVGGKQYDVSINSNLKTVTFSWIDGSGNFRTFHTLYFGTTEGIQFVAPFNDGNQTINGFTGINWNAASKVLNVNAGNNGGTIVEATTPIAVDKEAPIRWYNAAISNGNTYWVSENGFHVNGVDDAYGIKSLKKDNWSYFFLIYWPRFSSGLDLLAPVFLNERRDSVDIFYGAVPEGLRITANGRGIFREYGFLTSEPYPTTSPAYLSLVQLYNSNGYYFVQTSATSYDMVSAADARIWITWTQ